MGVVRTGQKEDAVCALSLGLIKSLRPRGAEPHTSSAELVERTDLLKMDRERDDDLFMCEDLQRLRLLQQPGKVLDTGRRYSRSLVTVSRYVSQRLRLGVRLVLVRHCHPRSGSYDG